MKYGPTSTFGNQRRFGNHGSGKGARSGGAQPSTLRYFTELRWLKNKRARIAKANRWAGRRATA